MLFIGPPFGNYIHLHDTISIKGTFTLEPRDGLFWQIASTLRYSFEYGGWVNRIGLRNNGLDWAIATHDNRDVCSIAIMDENQLDPIVKKIPENMNIEINLGCPNVKNVKLNEGLEKFLNNKRKWCILKLSPTIDTALIDSYYKKGFRQFHCSNTLPVPEGGLSGPSLKEHTSRLVTYIRKKYKDSEIIAGGGIRSIDDISHYKTIGANHFAVSTLLFNPIMFSLLYFDYISCKK